jgi:hypothetical protein
VGKYNVVMERDGSSCRPHDKVDDGFHKSNQQIVTHLE